MKKRVFAIAFVALLCLILIPASAFAAEEPLTRAELAELIYHKFQPSITGSVQTFTDLEGCTPAQKTAIGVLAANGVLSGSSAGTFDPNGIATRGQSAVIIWRMIGGTAAEQTLFSDVSGTPFAPAVNVLTEEDVLLASDAIDGGFKPFDAATETVVTTWLSRLEVNAPGGEGSGSESAPGGNQSYEASDWAQEELGRADQLGLIPDCLKGKDLTKDITRAEFAAVAVKVYEALSASKALPAVTNPFKDTNDLEVLKAYNTGITNGTGADTYEPDAILDREQMATMLTRVFKRVTMPGWTLATDNQFELRYQKPAVFADDKDISDWAKDSVYFMAANGIINGVGGNRFAPKNLTTAEEATGYANATREQALLIAVRMVEILK